MPSSNGSPSAVRVFGTTWCHDTVDTRRHLDQIGTPYEFIDIDSDARAEEWVKQQNGGKRKMPTVDVGGLVLSVPSEEELDRALEQQGMGA